MAIPPGAYKNFRKTFFLKSIGSEIWQTLSAELQEAYTICYGADLPGEWIRGEYLAAKHLNIDPKEARRRVNTAHTLLLKKTERKPRSKIGKAVVSAEKTTVVDHAVSVSNNSKRSWRVGHQDHKALWRSIVQQPWWEKIPATMRSLVVVYYGLDLPGEEIRNLRETAHIVGMKSKTASSYLSITKQYCKYFDPTLPFRRVDAKRLPQMMGLSHSEMTRQMWERKRIEEKKIWQRIITESWWEEYIRPSERKIVCTYMGLDLPGFEVRTLRDAASLLSTLPGSVGARYGLVKSFCKHFDPELPWDVKAKKPPQNARSRRKQGKEVLRKFSKTDHWHKLTEEEQRVIACYYGFDLPTDAVRGPMQVAKVLRMDRIGVSVVVGRVQAYVKYLDPSTPFNITPRALRPKTRTLAEDKKLFLELSERAFWGYVPAFLQRLVSCFYGFDLLGDTVRGYAATMKKLGLTYGSVRTLLWAAKATLKSYDASLPFDVTPFHEGPGAGERISIFMRYKRELFGRPDLDDAGVQSCLEGLNALNASDSVAGAKTPDAAGLPFVYAGLRDILPVALSWYGRQMGRIVAFDILDFVQEGNIGFWRALPNFDGTTRAELGVFARTAARDEIRLALRRHGASVSIGDEFTSLIRKLSRAWKRCEKYAGGEPTFDELVRAMGEPREVVAAVLDHMRLSVIPSRSLDAPAFKADEDTVPTLGEMTADERILPPEDELERRSWELRERWLGEAAEKALVQALSPVEQYVLRLRYGFDGESRTGKEIAEMLRTTEATIETIETDSIEKLRVDHRVLETLARFARRPAVADGVFRLEKIASAARALSPPPHPTAGHSAAAEKKDVDISDPASDHEDDEEIWEPPQFKGYDPCWLHAAISPSILEEELADMKDSNLSARGLVAQGLIPARVWYRRR